MNWGAEDVVGAAALVALLIAGLVIIRQRIAQPPMRWCAAVALLILVAGAWSLLGVGAADAR